MQTTNDNKNINAIHKLLVSKVFNNYMTKNKIKLHILSELPFYVKFDRCNDSLVCVTLDNYPNFKNKKLNELTLIFKGGIKNIRYKTVTKCNFDNTNGNKCKLYFNKKPIYCVEKRIIINKKSNKRKANEITNNNTKKIEVHKKRKSIRIKKKYISPSSLWNFFHNDTLIDWLKVCNITSLDDIIKKNYLPKRIEKNITGNTNLNFRLNEGLEFEKNVISWFHKKGFNVLNIESNKYNFGNYENKLNTIEAMKKGVDIIYQGYVSNNENKTHGIPDLIIRSDIINKIFGYEVITSPYQKTSNLKNKYFYVIVDIKNTSLHLNSDGQTLRNERSIKYYKVQLLIYNLALGKIQNYLHDKAYILGKRWFYNSKKINFSGNWNTKLGEIHYHGKDKYYFEQLEMGLHWLEDVKKNGKKWSFEYYRKNGSKYLLPDKPELFPNMKNSDDGIYHSIKKDVAKEIGEITQIAYCSIKHRNNAHRQNIYTFLDKDCTASVMGFKNNLKTIIDNILIVNKPNGPNMLPKGSIKNNINDWKYTNECEFFIDFETIGACVNKSSINNETKLNDFLFMIGVFHKDFGYKSFVTKSLSLNEETRIVNEFWKYINSKVHNKPCRFYHWTHHEPNVYQKVNYRHGNIWDNINFVDLYNIFKVEPIAIKGSLNFKLKSIARAIHDMGHIPTIWDSNNPCSNGMDAMILAYLEYKNNKKVNVKKSVIMRDIIEYNEKDCDVLYHILKFIRTKK